VNDFVTENVSGSIVEMLMARNPKAFADLINRMKDGEEAEAAMKASYKMSYAEVDAMWQKWIKSVP